jgi:hypothetical protein
MCDSGSCTCDASGSYNCPDVDSSCTGAMLQAVCAASFQCSCVVLGNPCLGFEGCGAGPGHGWRWDASWVVSASFWRDRRGERWRLSSRELASRLGGMCSIRKELLETAWEYFTVEEGKCILRQMRKGIENITRFVFLNKTSILLPCAMTTVESKTSLTTPLETIETSWYLAGWLDMSKSSRLLLYHATNCALWGLKPRECSLQ